MSTDTDRPFGVWWSAAGAVGRVAYTLLGAGWILGVPVVLAVLAVADGLGGGWGPVVALGAGGVVCAAVAVLVAAVDVRLRHGGRVPPVVLAAALTANRWLFRATALGILAASPMVVLPPPAQAGWLVGVWVTSWAGLAVAVRRELVDVEASAAVLDGDGLPDVMAGPDEPTVPARVLVFRAVAGAAIGAAAFVVVQQLVG